MACFIVPMAEAIVVSAIKKKNKNLKWLSPMLWGGSSVLAVEHLYTGELWTTELSVMLYEMATKGIMMALTVTMLWFVICKMNLSLIYNKHVLGILGVFVMVIIDFLS